MPITRRLPLLLSLIGLLPVPVSSWALGLGNAPASVTLGRPLDITVPVRLESGDELSAECVQAEVWHGDQRLSADAVRVRVTPANAGSTVLRVSSRQVIDEPVVTLQLVAGCNSRVQRRYVMFADPGPAAPAVPAAAAVVSAAASPVQATPATSPRPNAGVRPAPSESGATPAEPSRRETRAAARQSATGATSRSTANRPPPAAARTASDDRSTRRPAAQRQAAAAPAPRLRLDPAEPAPAVAAAVATAEAASAIQNALDAVAQAASAARASAEAASAAGARAAALEASLQRLQAQARASQVEFERLQALAARPSLSAAWTGPLVGLLLVVTVLALWLAWRLRGLRHAQELAWVRASTLAASGHGDNAPQKETSPLPLITSEMTRPAALTRSPPEPSPSPATRHAGPSRPAAPAAPSAAGSPLAAAVAPAAVPLASSAPASAFERTEVLPPTVRSDEHSARDVSIEELIDVDQQAEFFIALGQHQSAIDLLVGHLRQTGGGSPLTYLKLLEIYARLGDQPAYERTRTRFNHRFNAYAPEWGSDLSDGRSLEDYDTVLPRLQAAWPRPLDAMAELEALLFRKSRGELFDLPAYRDVLFLYGMARDFQEQDAPADPVDLLLPLDAQAQRSGRVGSARADSDVPPDERPTAPLDLDLTPQSPSASLFGDPLVPSSLRGNIPPSRR